jgi:predicted nuclease of predicted toxin-antitoxin system
MKVLLDTCVWGGATSELIHLGYDVWWTGELPADPGDDEILAIAKKEGRILVTLDKDFGELVFLHGLAHAGILRIVEIPSKMQGTSIHHVLQAFGDELAHGAIVTLKENRIRVRLPLHLPTSIGAHLPPG